MSGWIKLHRKLTEWEWYSDVNTTRVFMHLLLVANHKDGKWRGLDIKRGQKLTSISKLAKQTNLTDRNIRTAIKHLKSTNEVTSYSSAQNTVFTVVNYDSYQQATNEVTSERQASDKQVTTNKNEKNKKNENNIDIPRINYTEIMEYYNEMMPQKKIVKMHDKRKALIKKLITKCDIDIETLKAFIEHVSQSPEWNWTRISNIGANGVKYGPRPFEYYMTEENLIKVLEE